MNNDSYKPFVSAPLSVETSLVPMSPQGMGQQMMPPPESADSGYPEIYYEVYPLISEAVEKLIAAGYTPTPEMISSLVDAIIKNSGLWYEDDEEEMPEAVPAQLGFGFGSNPYRRRRRRHHNRNTLRDIVRILLLRELFDKGGHSGYYNYF